MRSTSTGTRSCAEPPSVRDAFLDAVFFGLDRRTGPTLACGTNIWFQSPRSPPRLLRMGASMIDFNDQVVIVTGAGRGLGRLYAMEFARLGGSTVGHDIAR